MYLFIWYFGTLQAVIYSLNLDLANKCMSLETLPIRIIDIMRITKFVYFTTTYVTVGAIFYKKTVDKSIVFLYLEFMILL